MLAAGVDGETQKQILEEMLQQAEEILEAGKRAS